MSRNVIERLPLHYQKSEGILELLSEYIDKGEDYLIKEIEYVNKREEQGKIKTDYSSYLNGALKGGYGNKKIDPPLPKPQKSTIVSSITQNEREKKERERITKENTEIDDQINSLDIDSLNLLDKFAFLHMAPIDKSSYITGNDEKKLRMIPRLRHQFFKLWLKENKLPN